MTNVCTRLAVLLIPALLGSTSVAAQSPSTAAQSGESLWAAEVSVGWDNSINGNIHSAGIGTVLGEPAIIESRSYGDVYGTGVRWRFGVGYRLDDRQELLGNFTYSSVSADVVELGTVGGAPLFGTFDDYDVWGLDVGYRRYFTVPQPRFRPYAGGEVGINVINEIDADLAVPALGSTLAATDFYDRTGAFTFGFNGGTLIELNPRFDINIQLGLRYVTGLSEIDGLEGTGLETINDDSGRWVLPFTVGARMKF
jgi:hypothetical protein